MTDDDKAQQQNKIQQLTGALEIVDILREEMEQWREEAQDDSKKECLDNVVGHISAIEIEYRQRLGSLTG